MGGEADHDALAHLEKIWRHRRIHTALDVPLPELAAIFQLARLFLGHDSGISHIAAAAGAPALLLFGPTDPDIWAPLSPRVRIVRAPGNDLTQLAVERVVEEILKSAL